MTLPTPTDVEAGYEGDTWLAKKGFWRLEVRWRGDHAKFHCRTFKVDEEESREARAFEYPHEIIEWMSLWFAQLANVKD